MERSFLMLSLKLLPSGKRTERFGNGQPAMLLPPK
jgi:hypothetical protein